MKIKIILLIFGLILFGSVCFSLINLNGIINQPKLQTGEVTINNQVIKVELAQTVSQQSKGLGGRDYLAADSGMLFVFPNMTTRYFWMKDMRFPIDIIWITDDKIVGIEAKVPAPIDKQNNLVIYSSPGEVNYVLEVNAGFCEQNNIQIGNKIDLEIN
jgi:uncharacterized protein